MKYLPIGLQSIREILEGGYVYVDKTGFAKELIENKQRRHCFFSRPRRFGKSLFLNTLEEIFKGNKALFQGYQIDGGDYDWPVHPVLSFNFAQIANETREAFESDLKESLEELAELSGVTSGGTSCQAKLRRLVTLLSKKGPVVVLVDEYDKPIIDNLHNPETAEANRQLLQSFFGVLKNLGQHVRFTFVTGITKFSQVSLFSGPNHLNDITMFPQYAGMMGYTEGELVQYFDKHIQAIAEERTQQGQQVTEEAVLSEIKQWYNGYRFSEEESYVYNPFSTLKFLETKKPKSYWYASGTPSFLIEQVRKHPESVVPLAGTSARESQLMDISSLEEMDLKALMFQTGYLTIESYNALSKHYQLGFPNQEVREAFIDSLVTQFAPMSPLLSAESKTALEKYDLTSFFNQIQVAMARFPYYLFISAQERTYHGFLLSMMSGMGLEVAAETPNSLGRVDLLVALSATIYVMELKLDSSAEAALDQVRAKQYHVPHLSKGKEVALVGLNFSSETRNVADWAGELLNEKGERMRMLAPTAPA